LITIQQSFAVECFATSVREIVFPVVDASDFVSICIVGVACGATVDVDEHQETKAIIHIRSNEYFFMVDR
jgi:hypothetical protein